MLRSAEMLELIPGMAVTQHSGSGKANQYFIRGFNLDHGTDFATSIEGMPINMRSHGHGQGYTDLNFIIPEAISTINYQKGSYSATQGDFSSAGSAQFNLANNLKHKQIELSIGEDNYKLAVVLSAVDVSNAKLIAAAEWQGYDGPWDDINENVNKKCPTSLCWQSFKWRFIYYSNGLRQHMAISRSNSTARSVTKYNVTLRVA